ncbi:MAG: helix-turn-helix domain-containing protein, partial [Paracoccaceae bacterium]
NLRGEISNETAKQLINVNSRPNASDAVRPQNEKKRILDALWRYGFHRGKTADFLGMSRKTLYNKMAKFGLSV